VTDSPTMATAMWVFPCALVRLPDELARFVRRPYERARGHYTHGLTLTSREDAVRSRRARRRRGILAHDPRGRRAATRGTRVRRFTRISVRYKIRARACHRALRWCAVLFGSRATAGPLAYVGARACARGGKGRSR